MEKQGKIELLIVNYSNSPGPRYCNQGDDSGEDYYHKELNSSFYEAVKKNCKLLVVLDGTDGFASSFLDEAFGNLVYDYGEELVRSVLTIKSDEEPEWIDMLYNSTYSEWSARRKSHRDPTITIQHPAWYRFIDGNYEKRVWVQI